MLHCVNNKGKTMDKNIEWDIHFSAHEFSDMCLRVGLFPMFDLLKTELRRKMGRELTEEEKEDMKVLWEETRL